MSDTLPLLDLHQYHEVDRVLFERLVEQLLRNPADAFLAMAFWFWLENNRFPGITTRLLSASDFTVNKIVDEAILCLNSLAVDQCTPLAVETAFTSTMLGRQVPLDMMHTDKSATIDGIKYFINDVCARIFTDILDRILEGNPADRPYYHPLNVPGFPHPIFGEVHILKLPLSKLFDVDDLWGWAMPPHF